MVRFSSACVLAAFQLVNVAQAQEVPTTYEIRTGTEQNSTLITSGSTSGYYNIEWILGVQTIINEDTGDKKMRWTHYLTADILETDQIMFEVSFYTGTDAEANTRQTKKIADIAEDGGRCTLQISSASPTYWTATVSDIYYVCNNSQFTEDTDDPLVRCYTLALNGGSNDNTYTNDTPTVEANDENDWTVPDDGDDEFDDPWCTRAGESGSWSPFRCKSIICVMERNMVTEDDKDSATDSYYDFAFVTDGVDDIMQIRPQRAKLYFNKDTYSTPMYATYTTTNTQITIYKSAVTMGTSLGAFIAGAYLYLF